MQELEDCLAEVGDESITIQQTTTVNNIEPQDGLLPISAHELPQADLEIRVYETNHSQFVNSVGMTDVFERILDAEDDDPDINIFFRSPKEE